MPFLRRSYVRLLKRQLGRGKLLWPLRQMLKYPLIHAAHRMRRSTTGPLQGIFFTTYDCNLSCSFCDLPQRHQAYRRMYREELTRDEMLRVVDDFAAIGTTGIGFTGGEPLLRKDTYALIARTTRQGMLAHMSSNGYPFTEEGTRRILDTGLDAVSISVDGLARTHDRLRGRRGSFRRAVEGIQSVLQAKARHGYDVSCTTTTVITRDNLEEVIPLTQFLADLGVDQIGFMPVMGIGLDHHSEERYEELRVNDLARAREIVEWLVEYKKKTNKIENTLAYLGLFNEAFEGRPLPVSCWAGYTTLVVDSWGFVYPCFAWAEMKKPVANVRELPLAQYWHSGACAETRKQIEGCRDCYWNCQTEWSLLFDRRRS